jgi:acetoin utilization deacetylase AcuC-like enzyme
MTGTTASIPVFYTPKQVAVTSSMSPSAGKPASVVASWQDRDLPIRIVEPEPVTVDDFALALDRNFVEGVLTCRRENGFNNRSAQVAASLPWTTGSMLSAARHVLAHGGVAAAPCSGFHHAQFDRPFGFCTFNGLMVTALKLRAEARIARIGILDCDQHFGDGTEALIERHNASGWIVHVTADQDYPREPVPFLAALPKLVQRFEGCDVVLYQAGADPHVNDPLGGFLDDVQLARRDAIVFKGMRSLGLPVAWNLAGGYQTPLRLVLDIHDRTMIECARSYLGEAALPAALRNGMALPGNTV